MQEQNMWAKNNLDHVCLERFTINAVTNNISKPSSLCSVALQIKQAPRFSGKYTTSSARIYCWFHGSKVNDSTSVKWHKAETYNSNKEDIKIEERFESGMDKNAVFFLRINDLRVDDKAVYFCQLNNTMGPGTELQVASKQQ